MNPDQWVAAQKKRWKSEAYQPVTPWHQWCDAKAKAWWKVVHGTRRSPVTRAVVLGWADAVDRMRQQWRDQLKIHNRRGWDEWNRKRINSWNVCGQNRTQHFN